MTLERRTPLKRSELKRGDPLKRAPIKLRPSRNEIPDDSRAVTVARSGGLCEANTPVGPHRAVHLHHKEPRRSRNHAPSNLLHVCSNGHAWIHANPTASYAAGWLIRMGV